MSGDDRSEQIAADNARLERACEALGEHFDSVQIFVTRHEPGALNGTIHANWGCGNFFTRYGVVRQWLIKEDERTREGVRSN